MSQTNFLIGQGELLTHDIKGPKRKPGKAEAYTFDEAIKYLLPQISSTSILLDSLPSEACPNDFAVARLAMNPSYIAKSFFPINLLRTFGLGSVGSRNINLVPKKWTKHGKPTECTTTELFIAGKRSVFRNLSQWIKNLEPGSEEALDVAHIEQFSDFTSTDRTKLIELKSSKPTNINYFEVGVHMLPDENSNFIQEAFVNYASSLEIQVFSDLGFHAGNLWFLPVRGERRKIEKLAMFVFVRIIRHVPKLRGVGPVHRSSGVSIDCILPSEQPLSSEPRVAILDGGLPKQHSVHLWLGAYRELDPKAKDDSDALNHGLGVTSAFLFGPIQPNGKAQRPFSYVDHLRVLDKRTETEDPLELYRTLGLIEEVLLSRQYEFINLSLGPDLPIEDTDVHAWTSVIDDLLSDGGTFMAIAVGNNGQRDRASGNARVQVPSDSVNAIAVGATNDTDSGWSRAPYSAIGPGRSPGVVKPDLVAFGGGSAKYFHVLAPGKKPTLVPELGTSFASPYLLRSAVGIRSILGSALTPLAIKALLVHGADPSVHDKLEVGWGKIQEDLIGLITCPSGVARVVYQGELKPGKYLRAILPLPKGGLAGKIKLKATFCYASPVDPQDASSYTRAGLDIVFRPNGDNIKEGKQNAETKGFFDMKKYSTEAERRSDMGKWETVLHGQKGMLGRTLNNPVFDIHYNAREAGGKTSSAEKIRYALIITVEAAKHDDLFNDILKAYVDVLVPIQPQVSLPIRV